MANLRHRTTEAKRSEHTHSSEPLLEYRKHRRKRKSPKNGKLCLAAFTCLLGGVFFSLCLIYTIWPLKGPIYEMYTAVKSDNLTLARNVTRFRAYEALTFRTEHFHTDRLSPTPMQQHHELILEEYNAFRAKHKIPTMAEIDDRSRIDPKNTWQELVLRVYGYDTCFARYFSKTLEALKNAPLSNIQISRLAPGQDIPGHTGPSNIVFRYLLALKVPSTPPYPSLTSYDCTVRPCTPTTVEWKESGQELIFNDAYLHSAKNPHPTEERIALLGDYIRDDFRGWRERLIDMMIRRSLYYFPMPMIERFKQGSEKFCPEAPSLRGNS